MRHLDGSTIKRQRFQYRSRRSWNGLPLLHVVMGGRGSDGHYHPGSARGVIAVGDFAVGLVALGGIAIGLLSVGGIGIGLVAFAGIAAGLVALGGIAAGIMVVAAIALGVIGTGAVTVSLALPVSRRVSARRSSRTTSR
jgi:hypothetical protein